MIKFGLGETVIEYYNFAKHHKRMAIHIARTFADGSTKDLINDEVFRKDVENNPDMTFTKKRTIYLRSDDTMQPVEDTFVWLKNLEYEDDDIEYYSVGASNTKQTTYVRLKFQFEYGRAYLDYKFSTSGSHAMHFKNLCSQGFVRSIINELVEDDSTLKDDGIAEGNGDNSFIMIILDENGEPVDCELDLYEIEQAFIGIEVYKFDHQIVEDEKELEEMR